MTDQPAPARLREIVHPLPETAEVAAGGAVRFEVAGAPFAELAGATLRLREGDGWADVALTDATDWDDVADRVAAAWELAAPRGLLEAGGR